MICYVIYDRNENVIYQSTYPPLDMSNAGYPQREALRARGEHLTFGDVPQLPDRGLPDWIRRHQRAAR